MCPLLVVRKPWGATALSATGRCAPGECPGRRPHGRDVAYRTPGIELARGGRGGGMRAIDLACAGAFVFGACAPADQNGSASGGPSQMHALTIHSSGNGSGTVRSADPAFECNAQCGQNLAASANVRLTAVPPRGSTSVGSLGPCARTDRDALTIELDRAVTANS